ncbi:acyl-CoA dehydrogenase family protein [Marinicrinis lubricantis]|uniref:Acyl-CoA dehydrogenase family protein n=1 Tax=Marinicrinis lubricantis TaxID=2086470 RepID=A0ABW1IKP6_9BACL
MISEQTARAYSAEMEQTRKLNPVLLQEIYEQGWFKLFIPEELGGRMMALPEALCIFEEVSRLDGNLGWLVTIGAGGGMFAGYMQPEARALFSPKEAVVAGSGSPSGWARKVDGGYLVSGEWTYCSGSSYATLFTANCRIVEGTSEEGEELQIRSFIFMPEQVQIVPDWNAFGLKATESHTMKAEQIFVPEERTFDLSEQLGLEEYAIYRYPFLPFAETSFTAVTLGLARHFLDEAAALAERNRANWEAASAERYSFVIDRIRQMESQWSHARETFYRVVQQSWEQVEKGEILAEKEQLHVGRVSKQTAAAAVHGTRELFPYLGMSVLMEDCPINRIWRDLHTVSQHVLLVSYETTVTG